MAKLTRAQENALEELPSAENGSVTAGFYRRGDGWYTTAYRGGVTLVTVRALVGKGLLEWRNGDQSTWAVRFTEAGRVAIGAAVAPISTVKTMAFDPAIMAVENLARASVEQESEITQLRKRCAALETALREIAKLKPQNEPQPDEDYDFEVLEDAEDMNIASANFAYGNERAYWQCASIAEKALSG